ncbi:hypothetical protein [Synechococcus elongatus]|uniref:hypothetical protein n=1 Tax=Synechococcus elongatus TaxID=32046 RepID=UPI0030D11776
MTFSNQRHLGVDTFFATETIPYQEGAIFKGNLRGEATVVQPRLAQLLQDRLGDRYRLFLINDPSDRPAVVVLPSTACEPSKGFAGSIFPSSAAGWLYPLDLFCAGCRAALSQFRHSHGARTAEGSCLAIGLAVLLGSRELAHRWMADRYQARLSLALLFCLQAELEGMALIFDCSRFCATDGTV